MKKKIITLAMTAILSIAMASSAFAAQWVQDNRGWKYQNDNNTYSQSTWQLIDNQWYYFETTSYMAANKWVGNYYLGSSGAMLVDTVTPDGYVVGSDGAWIPDGAKIVPSSGTYTMATVTRTVNGVTSDVSAEFAGQTFIISTPATKGFKFQYGDNTGYCSRVSNGNYVSGAFSNMNNVDKFGGSNQDKVVITDRYNIALSWTRTADGVTTTTNMTLVK